MRRIDLADAMKVQLQTTENLLGALTKFGGVFLGRGGDLTVPGQVRVFRAVRPLFPGTKLWPCSRL